MFSIEKLKPMYDIMFVTIFKMLFPILDKRFIKRFFTVIDNVKGAVADNNRPIICQYRCVFVILLTKLFSNEFSHSVSQSICLSLNVFVYLSVCLSVCLSISLCLCLCISLSFSLCLCLAVSRCLSLSLSNCILKIIKTKRTKFKKKTNRLPQIHNHHHHVQEES